MVDICRDYKVTRVADCCIRRIFVKWRLMSSSHKADALRGLIPTKSRVMIIYCLGNVVFLLLNRFSNDAIINDRWSDRSLAVDLSPLESSLIQPVLMPIQHHFLIGAREALCTKWKDCVHDKYERTKKASVFGSVRIGEWLASKSNSVRNPLFIKVKGMPNKAGRYRRTCSIPARKERGRWWLIIVPSLLYRQRMAFGAWRVVWSWSFAIFVPSVLIGLHRDATNPNRELVPSQFAILVFVEEQEVMIMVDRKSLTLYCL